MIIAATSDLHGNLPGVPECDVLVVAGDIGPATRWYHDDDRVAREWFLFKFVPWFRTQPARHVVIIAGNHDKYLERNPFPYADRWPCFHYLQDSGATIEGVKFWGSPWTPTFFDWAFMDDDAKLADKWAMIPVDTDVLVTHGPPHGLGDANTQGQRCGSVSLKCWREEANRLPQLHTFGHIHEGHGQSGYGWANVSHVNEKYQPVNPVQTFDVQPRKES
ncbi:MAG: metallophosphoesterase [Planctomycetota bacterium]